MRRSNGRRGNDNRNDDGCEVSAHRLNLTLSGEITASTPTIARRVCRLTVLATRYCTITACLLPLRHRTATIFLSCTGLGQAEASLVLCLRSSGSSRPSLWCLPLPTEPACFRICNANYGYVHFTTRCRWPFPFTTASPDFTTALFGSAFNTIGEKQCRAFGVAPRFD